MMGHVEESKTDFFFNFSHTHTILLIAQQNQTELRTYSHTVLGQKALQYLFSIRQQFAELGQFLCSVTLPSPLPHILHNLLCSAAEKENSSCENDIFHNIFNTHYLCVAKVLEQETSTLSWGYNTTSAFFKQQKPESMARRKKQRRELHLHFTCFSLFWTWAGLSNLSGWQIENKPLGRHNGGRKIDKGTIQTYKAQINVTQCP